MLLLKRREKHGRNATDRWSCKGYYEMQPVVFNFLTSDHIQQLSRFGRYFKCGKDDMLGQFPILQLVRRPSLIHQFATVSYPQGILGSFRRVISLPAVRSMYMSLGCRLVEKAWPSGWFHDHSWKMILYSCRLLLIMYIAIDGSIYK